MSQQISYPIDEVIERFKDSPKATRYIERIIERSDPDQIHWSDVDIAQDIKDGKISMSAAWNSYLSDN